MDIVRDQGPWDVCEIFVQWRRVLNSVLSFWHATTDVVLHDELYCAMCIDCCPHCPGSFATTRITRTTVLWRHSSFILYDSHYDASGMRKYYRRPNIRIAWGAMQNFWVIGDPTIQYYYILHAFFMIYMQYLILERIMDGGLQPSLLFPVVFST